MGSREEGGSVGPVGTVQVTLKFRATPITGTLHRTLSLSQVRDVIGLPADSTITVRPTFAVFCSSCTRSQTTWPASFLPWRVLLAEQALWCGNLPTQWNSSVDIAATPSSCQVIYKGKKLAEGAALPARPCVLMVIENAAAGEVDVEATRTPGWAEAWLPGPVVTAVDTVISLVTSLLDAVVGTAADPDPATNTAYPAIVGECVKLEVTFVADSATSSEIVVAWSAGACGELMEESHCRFEDYSPGARLIATQTVRSNGCPGEVVCTITDVSSRLPLQALGAISHFSFLSYPGWPFPFSSTPLFPLLPHRLLTPSFAQRP